MNKVLVIAGIGAGGTASAVGGAYMMGAFGDKKGVTTDDKDDPKYNPFALPRQLKDFKKADHKYCMNAVLSSFDLTKGTSEKLEKSFFPTPLADSKSYGCVIVNWNKTKYPNSNKWKGNFRGLWIFLQGDKGFVMFTSADASNKLKPQLDLTGGIYFIKKKGDSKEWESEKYQEIQSGSPKQISKDDFETKFPAVGTAITDKSKLEANPDYWGFVSGKDDFDNICSQADASDKCKDPAKPEDWFMGQWDWEDKMSPKNKITDWSKNGTAWLSNMYGNDEVNLSDLLDKIEGKGVEIQLLPTKDQKNNS